MSLASLFIAVFLKERLSCMKEGHIIELKKLQPNLLNNIHLLATIFPFKI